MGRCGREAPARLPRKLGLAGGEWRARRAGWGRGRVGWVGCRWATVGLSLAAGGGVLLGYTGEREEAAWGLRPMEKEGTFLF